MAKNLIPSCCKVLATQRNVLVWSRVLLLNNNNNRMYATFVSSENQRGVKRQHLNYSQAAAEAATFRQQSTDSQRPNHGDKAYRKSLDNTSAESRQRLNKIRFFYADPEIDKAIERPIIRLNPMTLMYMGVSNDNSHLLQSATYLRNEMPIRLAHFIKELRNLPFIVACNPAMLEIHERCINTFHSFENFEKEIKDISMERQFNQLVFIMLEMNKDLLALLCDGFKDARRYVSNEELIKKSLNKILSARLGIRLLCEHHIALNKQSNLNKMLLPDADDIDDLNETQPPVDHFESKYVQTTNGSGGDSSSPSASSSSSSSSSINRSSQSSNLNNINWIGIINKKFSPKQLIENSGKLATRICLEKYGVAPRLKIDGHTNAQFAYLPLPLEYILPEMLKNAFRATIEHHNKGGSTAPLPDVSVTIAVNQKDFIIRIRDRGGGIPHALVDKIFDYHFTTAAEKSRDSSSYDSSSKDEHHHHHHFNHKNNNSSTYTNNTNNIEQSLDISLDNTGMGMLCEATGTRGHALMHGYGFGLPTSKAYAEYLGGSVTCQSMQGIGSDFYLRLGLLDVEHETVRI